MRHAIAFVMSLATLQPISRAAQLPAAAFDDTPAPPLHIVIAYDERTAYRRAMRLLASSLCDCTDGAEVRPLPWRFAEMRGQPWRARSLADAEGADLIVVATAGLVPIPAQAIEWLENAFAARVGQATSVMALYERDADFERFGALCEVLVRGAAEQAGLQFIEPARLASAFPR